MDLKARDKMIVSSVPDSLRHTYLESGTCGACYITEDGKHVFKELHNVLLDKEMMKAFTYLESDAIVFPKTIVYKDEEKDENIIGYISDYIKGQLFDTISDDESIKTIITASDLLEKNLKQASNYGVVIEDVHPNNVIYTQSKELKIIDTDLYRYYPYEEAFILYKDNMREWGNFIIEEFGTPSRFKSDKLNEYVELLVYYGKMKPSILLNFILEEINNQLNHEIQTLGEFKEGQKLIKKL